MLIKNKIYLTQYFANTHPNVVGLAIILKIITHIYFQNARIILLIIRPLYFFLEYTVSGITQSEKTTDERYEYNGQRKRTCNARILHILVSAQNRLFFSKSGRTYQAVL